jgi:hypothetical protein
MLKSVVVTTEPDLHRPLRQGQPRIPFRLAKQKGPPTPARSTATKKGLLLAREVLGGVATQS